MAWNKKTGPTSAGGASSKAARRKTETAEEMQRKLYLVQYDDLVNEIAECLEKKNIVKVYVKKNSDEASDSLRTKMLLYLNKCENVARKFNLTVIGVPDDTAKFRRHLNVSVDDKPQGRYNLPPQLLKDIEKIGGKYEKSFYSERVRLLSLIKLTGIN